ncbi:MAG TPA: phosphoribosylglycinamide formyltransferase [Solirubrobacteraceae bacterium]|nr:phosphoribosylglycinamide formyltransferase [Solirubrobacteraceae bacterium]
MSPADPPIKRPLPIGVLASGEGTNLQALIDSVHGVEAEIVGVASNRPAAPALGRAEAAGIPHAAFPVADGEDRAARDRRIAEWISGQGAQLIVLAGYMQLLGHSFLSWFPDAVINVHPSLLPAFPGLGAVDQAIAYGVRVFGVSVHLVDDGVDTGPLILQRAVELPRVHRPEQVLEALRPLEHALLPEAVRLFARGALSRDPANPRRVLIADPT